MDRSKRIVTIRLRRYDVEHLCEIAFFIYNSSQECKSV